MILFTPSYNRTACLSITELLISRFQRPFTWHLYTSGDTFTPTLPCVHNHSPTRRHLHEAIVDFAASTTVPPETPVVIIEDDDWYSPTYLNHITPTLLGGYSPSTRYFLRDRAYFHRGPWRRHADLGQSWVTGPEGLSLLANAAASRDHDSRPFAVDVRLWRHQWGSATTTLIQTPLRLSFTQHPSQPNYTSWKPGNLLRPDPDLQTLESWLGDDLLLYLDWLS